MTREQIGQLLIVLWDSYPNVKARNPEGMLNTWEMAFGDKDPRFVYKAARLHIDDSPYFPTVADIKGRLKTAEWLVKREEEEEFRKLTAPTAPKKLIDPNVTFCDLCGLCDRKNQKECEF